MKQTKHEDRKSFSKWGLACLPPKSVVKKSRVRLSKPLRKVHDNLFPRSMLSRSKYGLKVPSKGKVIWDSGTRVSSFKD